MIQIPLEIGDTILAGRFKNKKIVVKEIGIDEYGLPTVNGRGILKIRIEKLMNKGKEMSKNKNETIKKIVKEQSAGKAFDIGRTIPVKIKKDGGKYWIYRINQDGFEEKALNGGFESKERAERASKLRGFTLVNDKYEVQEYDIDKQPKFKTTEEKVEWITEIIRKSIRDLKVSKKKLNEATDPKKIDRAIEELAQLEQQLADATEKINALKKELNVSAMEKRYKELVNIDLWDFLEQMRKDDERVARTKTILMTIKRYQTEKETFEYEKVLDFAMTQVNQDVKEKILMELKAAKTISRVKPSLSFSKAENKMQEANAVTKLIDWIKSFFSGLNAKLKTKGQKIDSNLDRLEKSLKI